MPLPLQHLMSLRLTLKARKQPSRQLLTTLLRKVRGVIAQMGQSDPLELVTVALSLRETCHVAKLDQHD